MSCRRRSRTYEHKLHWKLSLNDERFSATSTSNARDNIWIRLVVHFQAIFASSEFSFVFKTHFDLWKLLNSAVARRTFFSMSKIYYFVWNFLLWIEWDKIISLFMFWHDKSIDLYAHKAIQREHKEFLHFENVNRKMMKTRPKPKIKRLNATLIV